MSLQSRSLRSRMLSGWYRLIRQARNDDKLVRAYESLQQSVGFFKRVQILSFDRNAVGQFHALRSQHRLIGTNDLRIAAIVMANGATLISRNLRDFRQTQGARRR